MISNNIPILFDKNSINTKPDKNDYIFIHNKTMILCINGINVPTFQELSPIYTTDILDASDFRYLFSFNGRKVFLSLNSIELDESLIKNLSNYKFSIHTLRDFLVAESSIQTNIAFNSYHLSVWYGNNKYCGKCGNEFSDSSTERALKCDECNHILYPTISPVIIVGIHSKDRLLLTKYAHNNYKNYALVAGFVEIGENLEECVRREVFEEVGLKIKNIKYMGSQPWGLTQTVLSGFYAELDGDLEIHLDEFELKEAIWVKREDLPINPEGTATLTWTLIDNFKNNLDFLEQTIL